MANDELHQAVDLLFSTPDTLRELSVDDLARIFIAFKRNDFLLGLLMSSTDDIDDGQHPLSILGKNEMETRRLMDFVGCVYDRKNKALFDIVEVGSYAHYESLLNNEHIMAKESILRLKLSQPERPAWLSWLYQSETAFFQTQLHALALYERQVTKVIDELVLTYDTLTFPALSARIANDALLRKRPACFHVPSQPK